jgi:hypothetical protein
MFTKHTVVIITMLFSQSLHAQSQFVEVTVSDTAIVKADEFLYRLNFNADQTLIPFDTAKGKDPQYSIKRYEALRQKSEELFHEYESKIKNEGFEILPMSVNEAMNKMPYPINSFVVDVRSPESLLKLYDMVKNDRSVNGSIQTIKVSNEDAASNKLYKKLMAKARAKAGYLAKLNNKRIISLISFSDSRSPVPFQMQYYSYNTATISDSPRIDFNGHEVSIGMVLQNSITVKYYWK